MKKRFAVIGVGNMAKSIIAGITSADVAVSSFYLFDKFTAACDSYKDKNGFYIEKDIATVVENADCVLLSVKPQNYSEILAEIKQVKDFDKKLYISIGAGITSQSVSQELGGANVIRVLPNLPMTIGMGASVICKNDNVSKEDFAFVESVFASSGSITIIDERDMNAIIGVTSSSPAYVFKFINAIYMGAEAQGLNTEGLLDIICDVVIGSAALLKQSTDTPTDLISKVASKGGTTEQALIKLNEGNFDKIIENAMIACTNRANELGKK
jgi:pyrroline-5-carboxylate reductase